MYPYLETYTSPKNEYKVYFTGKLPQKEEPAKPPKEPPKEPATKATQTAAVVGEDKFRFVCNDYGRQSTRRIELGEVVAMSYKNEILLITVDEKGELLII